MNSHQREWKTIQRVYDTQCSKFILCRTELLIRIYRIVALSIQTATTTTIK